MLCRAAVEEFAVVGESAVDPAASEKDDILAAVLKSNNKGKLAIVDANGLPTDTKAQQRYRRFAYKALCLPMPSELNNSYRKVFFNY